MVMLSILVVVILGGAGLIVDGGRAMTARRHAANTAEAAARAAVSAQPIVGGLDRDVARSAVLSATARAGVAASDVQVLFVTDPTGHDVVTVTITERRSTVFLVLAGRGTMTVRATGSARFTYTT